jgi:hypothetical protein
MLPAIAVKQTIRMKLFRIVAPNLTLRAEEAAGEEFRMSGRIRR